MEIKGSSRPPWRGSIYSKLFTIAFLLFVLQIPIACIQGVISERIQTKSEAEEFITQRSGKNQTFSAPTLSIPYIYRYQDEQRRERSYKAYAEILPEHLKIHSSVNVQKLYRGIFEFPVYTTELEVQGTIAATSFRPSDVAEQDILWDQAVLNMGVSDPRTIQDLAEFKFDGRILEPEPGVQSTSLATSGIHFQIPNSNSSMTGTAHTFSTKMTLGGSQSLSFLPVGRTTEITMTSPWANPSFMGSYLPISREVSEEGFKATWKILDLGRSFPRVLMNSTQSSQSLQFSSSQFGVGFYAPVDAHRMSERALKYELFVIALTFLIFAMFEIFYKVRIHSIQYLLVGAALVLFYLLLLSLSEQIGFSIAYLLASATVLSLVSSYSKSILKRRAGSSTVGLSLALLYGFFFTLLQEQDYSLLIGTVGLTLILGFVMYLTRNIDWYAIGVGDPEGSLDAEGQTLAC